MSRRSALLLDRRGVLGAVGNFDEGFTSNPLPNYTRMSGFSAGNDPTYNAGPPGRLVYIAGSSSTGHFRTAKQSSLTDVLLKGCLVYSASANVGGIVFYDPTGGGYWIQGSLQNISGQAYVSLSAGQNSSFGGAGLSVQNGPFTFPSAGTPYWITLGKVGNTFSCKWYNGDPDAGGVQQGTTASGSPSVTAWLTALGSGKKVAPGMMSQGGNSELRALAMNCPLINYP